MTKSKRAYTASWRQASAQALVVDDEFCRLKEVHQAHACLTGLLSPIHRPVQPEEFSVQPDELRAMLRLIQGEMARRAGAVDEAIESLHRAFKAPERHKARA
ncbi:MAG: hypothetical protein JOY84_18155 [Curvibacter sp.]|nr:hypothetical protein [Curvibacter sp.]